MARATGIRRVRGDVLRNRRWSVIALIVALALLAVATCPHLAMAASTENTVNSLFDIFADPVRDFLSKLVWLAGEAAKTLVNLLDPVKLGAQLTLNAQTMSLGWNVTLEGTTPGTADETFSQLDTLLRNLSYIVTTISVAIQTPAGLILAIIFAVRCLKVLMESDNGPSGIPYLEKFGWILIQYAIFKMLLDYSVNISVAVFDTFQGLADNFTFEGATEEAIDKWVAETQSGVANYEITLANLGNIILFFLQWVLMFLVFGILFIAGLGNVYGRWIQVFFYLSVAPLFFALAGLDETRHLFVSFIKSLVALALAFVITVIIIQLAKITCISYLCTSVTSDFQLSSLLIILGASLMFYTAMKSCGSWARELVS